MFVELAEDNLEQLIGEHPRVVVQYSAGWCGNCRIMKPKFKKVSAEMEEVLFVLADAEKFPAARKLASVDNLPTFATFTDGRLTRQVQTNKFEVFKEFVDETTTD